MRLEGYSSLLVSLSVNVCTAYINCVDIAGLDFEKVWYKVLGQVIYHLETKTMVYKTLLLE